jgi:hypothetical protein
VISPYRSPPDEEDRLAKQLAELLELELALEQARGRRRFFFSAAAILAPLPWLGLLGSNLAIFALSRIGAGLWVSSLVLGLACWIDERSLSRECDRSVDAMRARSGQ